MMTSSNEIILRVTGPLCRNSPVTGEFPSQRPVTWSFDVFFDLLPNTKLSKQTWGWLFETPSRPLWRHCNALINNLLVPNNFFLAAVISYAHKKHGVHIGLDGDDLDRVCHADCRCHVMWLTYVVGNHSLSLKRSWKHIQIVRTVYATGSLATLGVYFIYHLKCYNWEWKRSFLLYSFNVRD